MSFEQHPSLRLVIALGIGLLIGAERERRKGRGLSRSAAGVRTFALTAFAGGLSLPIGGELLPAVAAASVAAFSVISYHQTACRDPGLTSEMALFATVPLGALARGHSSVQHHPVPLGHRARMFHIVGSRVQAVLTKTFRAANPRSVARPRLI